MDSEVSRRKFLKGATTLSAAAIAGRGIYSVLDEFPGPTRAYAATPTSYKQEQYLIPFLETIADNGQYVLIPPVYNDVFTAVLQDVSPWGPWDGRTLVLAQSRLESALQFVEGPYQPTAAGLTIVVAWGLPYFENYVNGGPKNPWNTYAPVDVAASKDYGQPTLAVLPAKAFSSDPGNLKLEYNHVAFKLRSDHSDTLQQVENQLFYDSTSKGYVGNLFKITSKRIGFLGRGFGTTAASKALALAPPALPGADQIPPRSQLLLGFTSTQNLALGPDNIPSFETLGLTDQMGKYFSSGCAMHLSHLNLDIVSWYGKSYEERVHLMTSPTTKVPAGQPVTLANGPAQVATFDQVKLDAKAGLSGHNSLLQMATRLGADVHDAYGRLRRKGTAVPAREDFNTLDNPFALYFNPDTKQYETSGPKRAGMHFAVFVPTSDRFHRARGAMDGEMPKDKGYLNLSQGDYKVTPKQAGFNSVMEATHRQNYLVPPRAHRSFPLAELL